MDGAVPNVTSATTDTTVTNVNILVWILVLSMENVLTALTALVHVCHARVLTLDPTANSARLTTRTVPVVSTIVVRFAWSVVLVMMGRLATALVAAVSEGMAAVNAMNALLAFLERTVPITARIRASTLVTAILASVAPGV